MAGWLRQWMEALGKLATPAADRGGRVFSFRPRWKEQLVVVGPGGAFVLELPMGILSAYLPPQQMWRSKAPAWAADLWPVLQRELEEWCKETGAILHIDETASVYSVDD